MTNKIVKKKFIFQKTLQIKVSIYYFNQKNFYKNNSNYNISLFSLIMR